MAIKTKYYKVEDYNKYKAQRGPQVIPQANLLAAADYVQSLFEKKKFLYGVLGELELLCMGLRREMMDLHIAYDDKDFNRIRTKLEADQRYVRLRRYDTGANDISVQLPEGMNPLFTTKILVRTGPAYKDAQCTTAIDVEVNLIPPGRWFEYIRVVLYSHR